MGSSHFGSRTVAQEQRSICWSLCSSGEAMSGIGAVVQLAHKFVTWPQGTTQGFCNVIKIGTFCRTVVWPCLPPLKMYQYIRAKDEDYYTTEVLYFKSGSSDHRAFF